MRIAGDDILLPTTMVGSWPRPLWLRGGVLRTSPYELDHTDMYQRTLFEDAVRLCVEHPLHASFFCTKLWSYFIPTAPDADTLTALQGVYVGSGRQIRPVVEAILQHPDFLNGPELVTPPVVYNAGLLRAIGRPIDTTAWAWLSAGAGQQLFYPPNVSGWDFTHWLDTSTAKARWPSATRRSRCAPAT